MDRWIKYPLYSLFPELSDQSTFDNVNEYVKSCDPTNKRFCVLINRHDMGNTRIPIYNLLSKIDNIDCPGKLLNNCSNVELNNIGIPEYVRQYKFTICSENFGEDHPGYITEKILNSCLSGAIPIYYGRLDVEDLKIFNIDRILILNATNIHEISDKVEEFMSNPVLFCNFYRQPVFKDSAYNTIVNMNTHIMTHFDHIRGLDII
jgi:hypothetical protein